MEETAKIVGARPIEVTVMNTLSVNIHLGLVSGGAIQRLASY